MTHSRYGHPEEIVPRRASGYSKDDKGFRNADFISMTQPYAAGSLMSTVDDLAIWDRALSRRGAAQEGLPRPDVHRRPSQVGALHPLRLRHGRLRLPGARGSSSTAATSTASPPTSPASPRSGCSSPSSPTTTPRTRGPTTVALRIVAKAIGKPIEERKPLPARPRAAGRLRRRLPFRRADHPRHHPRGVEALLPAQRRPKTEILATARDDFFFPEGDTRLHFRRDAQGKVTGVDFPPLVGADEIGTRTNDPLPR